MVLFFWSRYNAYVVATANIIPSIIKYIQSNDKPITSDIP